MAYADEIDEFNSRGRALSGGAPGGQSGPPVAIPPPGVGVGTSGGTPGGATPPPPGQGGKAARGGTGFVNLERYLGANQGAGQAMANQVASGINDLGQTTQGQIDALRGQSYRSTAPTFGEINPDLFKKAGEGASLVGAQARMAGGQGVGTLLQDAYGKGGGYGSGMRGFDTFLTRAEGSGTLDPLAGKWGDLQKQLGAMEGNYRPSSADAPPAFQGAPSMSPPMTKPPASGPAGKVDPRGMRDRRDRRGDRGYM